MNRSQRRAQARAHRTAQAVATTATTMPGCPDCTAHVEPEEVSPGVLVLSVLHDETCPTFRAIQARR